MWKISVCLLNINMGYYVSLFVFHFPVSTKKK